MRVFTRVGKDIIHGIYISSLPQALYIPFKTTFACNYLQVDRTTVLASTVKFSIFL